MPSIETMVPPLRKWLETCSPLKEVLDQIAKAVQAEQAAPGQALQTYEQALAQAVGAMQQNPEVQKAAARLAELKAAADSAVAQAAQLAKDGKLIEAAAAYEIIAARYAGHPIAVAAVDSAAKLRNSQELKAQQARLAADEQARKEADAAQSALTRAQGLITRQNYLEAESLLKTIIAKFPATEGARLAREELDKLMADPRIAAVLTAAAADKECRKIYGLAEMYAQNGMSAEALAQIDLLLARYPDTEWAAKARLLRDRIKP
ncbi:MAG: hypothetical protein ABIF71_06270 [Planctomycetota bacterium]